MLLTSWHERQHCYLLAILRLFRRVPQFTKYMYPFSYKARLTYVSAWNAIKITGGHNWLNEAMPEKLLSTLHDNTCGCFTCTCCGRWQCPTWFSNLRDLPRFKTQAKITPSQTWKGCQMRAVLCQTCSLLRSGQFPDWTPTNMPTVGSLHVNGRDDTLAQVATSTHF